MIEKATTHISSTKRVQADVGELLRVLDALDKAGYKVVRKGPGLMSTVDASDSMRPSPHPGFHCTTEPVSVKTRPVVRDTLNGLTWEAQQAWLDSQQGPA